MTLEKVNLNIKCDMPGCSNKAEYMLKSRKMFKIGDMFFCKQCLEELYAEIGKIIIPKSPENIFKKIKVKEK